MFEPEELMARIVDLEEQLKVSEMAPPAAEQLIACLEGEIAKRDEELAACRVAVENCEVFRAELATIKEQEPIGWYTEDHLDDKSATTYSWTVAERWVEKGWPVSPLYAEPVSEAKAQGVVMPERWNVPRPMWKDARQPYGNPLNHADIEAAEKFNLALDEVARLNAAPVQQVSVPECYARLLKHAFGMTFGEDWNRGTAAETHRNKLIEAVFDCRHLLAAAPAAPAADAGLVDMYSHLQKVTPYRFKKIQDAAVTDGGDVLYFHKDRFDAALLDDMAAHSANGVV